MAIVCYGCLGTEGQPLCYGHLGTEWLMHFMVAKRPFRSQFSERKGNGRGTVICMGERNGTVPTKQALRVPRAFSRHRVSCLSVSCSNCKLCFISSSSDWVHEYQHSRVHSGGRCISGYSTRAVRLSWHDNNPIHPLGVREEGLTCQTYESRWRNMIAFLMPQEPILVPGHKYPKMKGDHLYGGTDTHGCFARNFFNPCFRVQGAVGKSVGLLAANPILRRYSA